MLAACFASICQSRGCSVELAEVSDFITTCGEGQIPQNALKLYEELGRAEAGVLEGVNFSLFEMHQEQADYIGVKVSGPFKGDTYRY